MKRLIAVLTLLVVLSICCIPINQAQAESNTQETFNISKTFSPKPITNAEIQLIARVVYAEARGEPFLGKVAVANVVLNRYESGRFGKTVTRVVRQRHQFCVARRTNQACRDAVLILIRNNLRLLPPNVYYFKRSAKRWRNFKRYCKIARHNFFAQGKPVPDTNKPYINKNGRLVWIGGMPADPLAAGMMPK